MSQAQDSIIKELVYHLDLRNLWIQPSSTQEQRRAQGFAKRRSEGSTHHVMRWRCLLFFSVFRHLSGACGNVTEKSSCCLGKRKPFPVSSAWALSHRFISCVLSENTGAATLGWQLEGHPSSCPGLKVEPLPLSDHIPAWCFHSVSVMKPPRRHTQMVFTGLCSMCYLPDSLNEYLACEWGKHPHWPTLPVPGHRSHHVASPCHGAGPALHSTHLSSHFISQQLCAAGTVITMIL